MELCLQICAYFLIEIVKIHVFYACAFRFLSQNQGWFLVQRLQRVGRGGVSDASVFCPI